MGSPLLPHLTALSCISALSQSLLINTDLSMQNNIKRCIIISIPLANNVNLENIVIHTNHTAVATLISSELLEEREDGQKLKA